MSIVIMQFVTTIALTDTDVPGANVGCDVGITEWSSRVQQPMTGVQARAIMAAYIEAATLRILNAEIVGEVTIEVSPK